MEIARKVYRAGLDTKHGEREILTAFAVVLVESGGGVTMRNPPRASHTGTPPAPSSSATSRPGTGATA